MPFYGAALARVQPQNASYPFRPRLPALRTEIIPATEPSPFQYGEVLGTVTSTGTVSGKEGHRGLVSATITSSGTVTGQEHHFGTVSATITSSATVVGKEGHRGLVSATITSSGTVTGQEHHFGTVSATTTVTGAVAGSEGHRGLVSATTTLTASVVGRRLSKAIISSTITSSGVVTGQEDHRGTVLGVIQSDGLATGSQDEPVPPTPAPPSNGGGYAQHMGPAGPRRIIRRSGSVSAVSASMATARGHRASTGSAAGSITVSFHLTATSTRRSVLLNRTSLRGMASGVQTAPRDHEYLALYAEYRRLRDDHELLLTL